MRSAWLLVVVGLSAGCARAARLPASPTPWDVTVGLAATGKSVTAAYRVESAPAGARSWTFRTTRSLGDWTEGSQTTVYDSADPQPGDPWPFVAQHAIAAVPAQVRVDRGGRPEGLVSTETWKDAAWDAVIALKLPAGAAKSTGQLVDEKGLMRDLVRSFPGTPTDGGPWVRTEDLAGFSEATVTETCQRADVDGLTTWTCAGTATGAPRDGVELSSVTTRTVVVVDARGLVRMEADRTAILMSKDPAGNVTHLAPWAQQRAVERREATP